MTKIRRKISGVEYVNRTSDNLLKVKEESLLPLYEDLRSADCIVCGGSGRSLHSLNIAMSQIATMKNPKVVITREDVGFPGRGMYDAASKLEKRHRKIILLINSGSGESEDPKNLAENLEEYLEETASEKFTMGLITSNPDSSIANIVRRYGNVVEVEGRGKQTPSDVYSETGIMGDIFELGSLFLLQMMTEAIFEDCSVERVFELINKEAPVLGEIIDSIVDSEAYKVSIDFLERRSDVFLGGRGTAEEVAKMTAIRLFHIKKFLGDNVYIARGVNTPRPRAGDFEILISYSGETKLVVNWSNTFRDLGGTVLSLIGRKGSPLERNSDSKILIEERVELGRPRRFYMRAAYVLSCLPILLTERLSLKGLRLPEYILNWYHSVIE
ncbi:MAG: SIS domain-containing protein [Candidatus Bathyarchaeota archaeon]|nr:SIS domain-containing protein [Candidatus Bathyarchaeota archaeon]MDH5663262.1 SIS domain-containing protein [Candidatus Bathyarchaeota archaeon]